MTSTNGVHTADNAIPPLGDDLEDLLEDLAAVRDPGVDQILAGLRYLALTRHTTDRTQTLIAALAGGSDGTNVVAAIGQVIARLTNPDSNPVLRDLAPDQQKRVQLHGETTGFVLAHHDLAQFASDTCAAITDT
ncbi:hypothetical protein [Streptomyces sp. AS02]|uniref:hypothetical protein n=1 Tax=Streptomyces sp. AS02 TaxID=2938946 RepID=UPI0020213518|nr:hypothetical protein [Streptomyces sp. AS02]MCL8016868.1 hypothetical protein [Streptomyces sp. AS02]